MDQTLPCGVKLPSHFALQHPKDYIQGLRSTIFEVLQASGVDPCEIAGVGVDFTASTIFSLDKDGNPLCFSPEFEREPLSYAILWKHHATQPYADEMNRLITQRGDQWLELYGGKVSSEWMFPKIVQIFREAPHVYRATAQFTEAGDWITYLLTGQRVRSNNIAGYKAQYADGRYPPKNFFTAIDPALTDLIGTKISKDVRDLSHVAGRISPEGAALTGLAEGTPVAIPMIDAHAALPALNVTGEGEMLAVIGTSFCYILHSRKKAAVPGAFGCVKDAMIPGFYTYESGQSGAGDSFDWFVHHCVPASYTEEAASRGISIHALLREKAMRLRVGENHLLALDWLNGDRSLKNDDLSGVLLGLTLQTKPEEIYRALIEATAYGARQSIELYESCGISIRSICAAGGIAQKDPLLMQIFADVTNRTVRVASTKQAGARGSAVNAAVAGGLFSNLTEASAYFALPNQRVYEPIEENRLRYEEIYQEYKTLYHYFGQGENSVLKRLKTLANKKS
jgi:L-ribulokinase